MAQGKASGRLVVLILFAGALVLAGIVFLTGYRQKMADRRTLAAAQGAPRDSAVTPDSVRAWLARLPKDWIKVTPVEGQGFVLFVPCYSSNSLLTFKTAPDSAPGLACEYCDSLGDFAVRAIATSARDSAWELRVDPAAGEVKVARVNDSLLQKFPETPFRDRLLLWIRPRNTAVTPAADGAAKGPGAAAPAADTMFFVPKSQENEFETLRAEDENPEGCGGTDTD